MNNTLTRKIYDFLEEEYENDEGFKFTQDFSKSGFIAAEVEDSLEIYKEYRAIWLELMSALSYYSYERFVYTFFTNTNRLDTEEELKRAVSYAYGAISLGARSCKCYSGSSNINMHKINFMFSINLIWRPSARLS